MAILSGAVEQRAENSDAEYAVEYVLARGDAEPPGRTLQLLHDFGIDPRSDCVRRAVAIVRDHCRWEHAGQPFFSGEVEPCINGRTVTLGVYFDQDVDGIVARLLDEQLDDDGWNCEAENGSVRSSFDITINVLEGLLSHERAAGGSAESAAARRRGEEYLLERRISGARERLKSSILPGCSSRFRPAGATMCCAGSTISARPAMRRTRGWAKQSSYSDPSSSPMVPGCWRTRIPARSTFRSRMATIGPAGGTRCARCAPSTGTSSPPPDRASLPGGA
jgi:hypothetical protein